MEKISILLTLYIKKMKSARGEAKMNEKNALTSWSKRFGVVTCN